MSGALHSTADPLREILARAARTGEVLRIVYHGGSQPGTVREIVPIDVTDTEMRARDFAGHQEKLFKLAKIEIPDPATNPPEWIAPCPPEIEISCSIKVAFEGRRRHLESLGWRVELSKNSVALYGRSGVGDVQENPDMRLDFEKPPCDHVIALIAGLEGVRTEERDEERRGARPFRFYNRRDGERRQFGGMRYFGKMSSAISAFLSEATANAPTPPSGA